MKQYAKKSIAIVIMVVLIISNCLSVLGATGWCQDNGTWYYKNTNGGLVKNTFRKSGELWFWLNESGTLIIKNEGYKIEPIEGIFFTLKSDGAVNPIGKDIDGKKYDLNKLIQDGDIDLEGDLDGAYWKIVGSGAKRAWQYVENGKVSTGMISADGFDYYADDNGNIIWYNKEKIVDGYYMMEDYTCARNRWISISDQWYYFGDDGKQVFGVKEIRGETYDFGTKGYVDATRVPYGAVIGIEFTAIQISAEVGEAVELPFEIYVEEKVWIASGSNAVATGSNLPLDEDGRWEETGEIVEVNDYSVFKYAYSINHSYRVNVGNFNTKYVEGDSNLKYEVETKMQIDWDEQTIRIPIKEMGAIFGTLRVDKGKSEPFGMVCNYPSTSSKEDQIQDIFQYQKNDQKVAALRNLDSDIVTALLKEDKSVRKNISLIENDHLAMKNVEISKETAPVVKTLLGNKEVDILGLGLSVETGGDKTVSFSVEKSTDTVPGTISNKYSTIALEISASGGGIKSDKLAVPVYITLPIPKRMSADKVKLFHVHGKEVEEIDMVVEAGVAEFVTDSFSTFIFAEEKSNSGGGGSGSGGGGGGSSSSRSTSTAAQFVIPENTGSWSQNQSGWMFVKLDGKAYIDEWIYVKGQWYRIGADGYMLQGWNLINEKQYYLTPLTGEMKTGWLLESGVWYYLEATGTMQTGWQLIEGVWYYLGVDGKMLANTKTPDGYAVNVDGAWIQ